jgi:hypothetical protein
LGTGRGQRRKASAKESAKGFSMAEMGGPMLHAEELEAERKAGYEK